jgi:hypothetical protein
LIKKTEFIYGFKVLIEVEINPPPKKCEIVNKKDLLTLLKENF